MKQADIVALMKGIAPVLAGQIEAATKPLIERLTETRNRLADTVERLAQAETTIVELRAKAAEPPAPISVNTPAVKQAIAEAVATITIDPHDERVRSVIREECEAAAAALPPPEPGKSVTIEEVTPMIERVVASHVTLAIGLVPGVTFADAVKEACQAAAQAAVDALPPAPAGKSVSIDEVRPVVEAAVAERVKQAMVDTNVTIVDLVSTAVGRAVSAIPPAEPGKSVTIEELRPVVEAAVAERVTLAIGLEGETVAGAIEAAAQAAVAALPVPEKGDPGTSVKVEDVMPRLAEIATDEARKATAEAFQAIRIDPAAEPWAGVIQAAAGDAAQAAVDALPPAPAGKSVSIDEIRPIVAQAIDERLPEELAQAIKALPKPEDGLDGVGIENLLIDRDGRLVVTKTDGGIIKLDRIVGEDGKPGLGFDDIEGEDQGRDYVIRFVRGEKKVEFKISKLTIADTYQGVWRPGDFKRGDVVTWGGSLFMAQRDSSAKPEANDDWRMIVKRGRDGVRKQYDSEAPRPRAKVEFK